MKIILDAMGGDNAPEAPVLGALDAVKTYGAEIILVGRGDAILEVLKKNGLDNLPQGIEIAHADDVVDMHDDPGTVLHKRKNSSMVIGLKMLAEGRETPLYLPAPPARCSPVRPCLLSGFGVSAGRPWRLPCPPRRVPG